MRAVLAGLSICVATAAAPPAAARTIEYLHIEANAGGSSGGHTALCFEDACFHYQQAGGQLIRLHREHPARLEHGYRVIGNRTINATRIELGDDLHDRLRATFEERYHVQEAQGELLDELGRDVAFLELLVSRGEGPAESSDTRELLVPGSGYFSRHPAPRHALDEVGRRIADRHGADWLAALSDRVDTEIATIRLDPARDLPAPNELVLPPVWRGPARRHRQLLAARAAIDVLHGGGSLREGATIAPATVATLRDEETAFLELWAARVADSVVSLFGATRQDWGYPALVSMARMLALRESGRRGQLIVLDVFPDSGAVIDGSVVRAHPEAVAGLRSERRADLERVRGEFFGAPEPREILWSRLELTTNLVADLDSAVADGSAIRVPPSPPLPRASVRRGDWPLPAPPLRETRTALHAARDRHERYEAELRSLYGYDLVRRNCTTEITRVVSDVLAATNDVASGGASTTAGGALDFVPFVSARSVRRSSEHGHPGWRVVETEERPSYRRMALASMRGRESRLRVALRESSPATAHAYRPNTRDPVFAFFTEEAPALRPVLGAINLAAGLLTTGAGALSLPIDGGRRLRRGLSGMLFSLPELGFVTLRKGTYPVAPRAWLERPAH